MTKTLSRIERQVQQRELEHGRAGYIGLPNLSVYELQSLVSSMELARRYADYYDETYWIYELGRFSGERMFDVCRVGAYRYQPFQEDTDPIRCIWAVVDKPEPKP